MEITYFDVQLRRPFLLKNTLSVSHCLRNSPMPLLTVHNLSVAFRGAQGMRQVVDRVSFAIDRGEIFALVGESGSGKSVTALSIPQLHERQAVTYPSGSVTLDGQELLGLDEKALRYIRGNKVGMIFQEPMSALNPLHTIGRQIAEMIRLHQDIPKHAVADAVRVLLDKVGLSAFRDRLSAYPHQLSGGERQRVVIAMAIANNPDLLIADEPTTALDAHLQERVMDLLKMLCREMNMAVLLISHDLRLVETYADKVGVMKDGNIVEQKETGALFADPQHAYTRHLLSCFPKGDPLPLSKDAAPILEAEHVSVHFPAKKNFLGRPVAWKKSVDDVSLILKKGEALGVVGESGSGKTTLCLALLRLITPTGGRIVYLGEDIRSIPAARMRLLRRRAQFVFQDPYSSLNPRMPIRQIVGEGLRVHLPELRREERLERVKNILSEVGLSEDILMRYPHEFSGGQRQRINIARAMVLNPDFVVFDEPTSALDLSLQAQIIELLRDLQRRRGASYLFISHDLHVVRTLCHRAIVMKDGKIIREGAARDVTL